MCLFVYAYAYAYVYVYVFVLIFPFVYFYFRSLHECVCFCICLFEISMWKACLSVFMVCIFILVLVSPELFLCDFFMCV